MSSTLQQSSFRLDINGLRAWAVTAVVLYHFGLAGLSGGFVGVDVFFVISGFLMTGIISRGLQQGRFSIWAFYWDRAKRIIPALLLVIAVLLAIGWLWFMPDDYKGLARHSGWSLLFKSNIGYLHESGYFDSAAREKWLLHTWSLSVEWQFYLLFPLLLAAVWKLCAKRGALIAVHVLLALASLVACVWMTRHDSTQAFYLLQYRAWEMLLGGLVCLLFSDRAMSSRSRRWLEGFGFLLIVAAIGGVQASSAWPGMLALVPTMGAALVLAANRQDSPWTRNPVAQWLGTRSYSVYLWHWPLVVGLSYLGRFEQPLWTAGAVLLTLLLGEVSYRWVEVPTRQALGRLQFRYAVPALVSLLLGVFAVTQWAREDGVPGRLAPEFAAIDAQTRNRSPQMPHCPEREGPCVYGGSQIKAIMVGDSHARALVTAAAAALPNDQAGLYFQASAGCLFLPGARYPYERDGGSKCAAWVDRVQKMLNSRLLHTPLIVINRNSIYTFGHNGASASAEDRKPQVRLGVAADEPSDEYLREFTDAYVAHACALAEHRQVYLMRPIPEMIVKVPNALGRSLMLGHRRDVVISRAQYESRNRFVWAAQDRAQAQCGVHILDPLPYLCDEQVCYGSQDGMPLYSDDNHLSEYGNRLLTPMFAPVLRGEG